MTYLIENLHAAQIQVKYHERRASEERALRNALAHQAYEDFVADGGEGAGLCPGQIAELLGVNIRAVYQWFDADHAAALDGRRARIEPLLAAIVDEDGAEARRERQAAGGGAVDPASGPAQRSGAAAQQDS